VSVLHSSGIVVLERGLVDLDALGINDLANLFSVSTFHP
jgi:hypothetical protein